MKVFDINHPYFEPLLIGRKVVQQLIMCLIITVHTVNYILTNIIYPPWNQQFAPENGWQRKMKSIYLFFVWFGNFPSHSKNVPIPSNLRFWVKSTNLSLTSCWPLPAFRLTLRKLRRWKPPTPTWTSDARFRASRVKVGSLGGCRGGGQGGWRGTCQCGRGTWPFLGQTGGVCLHKMW